MSESSLNVLILEDRPYDVELMLHELKRAGYEVEYTNVYTREAYEQTLNPDYDVILSDYSMPQFNAMEALKILQDRDLTIPFLVVTGSISEEVAVDCMKQGAEDYLLKDRLTRLGPAVKKARQEHVLLLEKQQAEVALEKSEKLYRTIFENTGSAMVIISQDSTIQLANEQFCFLSGFSKQKIEGRKKWTEFVHPDDKEMMMGYHQLRRIKPGEAPQIYTFRFLDKNQKLHHILLNVGMIEGTDQSVAALIDITKRVKMQKKLQDIEKRYQSIFEGVQDAVFVESKDHQILDVNQRACEMFGYSRAEFLTKTVYDIVPEGNKVITLEELKQSPLENVEAENVKAGGERFPVELSAQIQTIENEEVMVVVLRDITERKKSEKALQRQLKELTALHAIAQTGTQEVDEDLIIQKATAVIGETLQPDSYGVLLISPQEQVLQAHPSYVGLPPSLQDHRIHLGEGVTGKVAQSGKAVLHNNVPKGSDYIEGFPGIVSELCVPIKTKHNILGVINVESTQEAAFDNHDQQLLLTLARQLATAIDRARLFSATDLQVKRLQSLHTIDQAISSSLDLKITFGIVMDQIINQLEIDAADILLLNPYTQILTYQAGQGFHTRTIEKINLRLGSGYAGRVALNNQEVTVKNLPEDENSPFDPFFLQEEGFVFYHALPLTSKGQTKGVLELFHRSPKQFNPGWKQYLQALVGQVAIAIDNAEMFENLQKANLDLSLAYDTTLEGWARALELRHHETKGHSQRVTDMALNLARKLGLRGETLTHIRRGALLHDIGKIAIPDHILLKPGPLTDEEWEIVIKHPTHAKQMLEPIKHLEKAMEIPLYHHERWNGSGYPQGLKKDIIPLSARIFAVVDVWDALTSDRPYRNAWSVEKTLQYIEDNAGVLFDPKVVKAFLKLLKESS